MNRPMNEEDRLQRLEQALSTNHLICVPKAPFPPSLPPCATLTAYAACA